MIPARFLFRKKLRLSVALLAALVLGLVVVGLSPATAAEGTAGMVATMTVDTPVAAPGDVVTFTITATNISSKAMTVLLVDTLPAELEFQSAAQPSGCSRTTTNWSCSPGGASTLSVSLRVIVAGTAGGKDLVNGASVNVQGTRGDDETEGGEWGGSHTWQDSQMKAAGGAIFVEASVHVLPSSVRSPGSDVSIRLGASQGVARPGEPLNYRIEVSNSGTGSARNAIVVAHLPQGVALASTFPSPARTGPDGPEWDVNAIPAVPLAFLVNGTFASGGNTSEVLAAASVTYVDSDGETQMHREVALSLLVAAVNPPGDPAAEGPVPWTAIGLLLAGMGIALVFAQRVLVIPPASGIRVERLFLLHRSGLVLKHFSPHRSGETDPDILGAMLTVVQKSLEDAVDPSAGPLRRIRFGGREILFAQGGNAILAAVVGKGNPGVFFAEAPQFLADLENRSGVALANWDGIPDRLEGIDGAFRTFTKGLISHRG